MISPSLIRKQLSSLKGKNVKEKDVAQIYAFLQYTQAHYLIQRSIRKAGSSITDRPYIDKSRRPEKLKPDDIAPFFNDLNLRITS